VSLSQQVATAGGFTGRTRRATRPSVKIIDAIAKYVICIGGIGVTIAFTVIIGFLVWVAVPLFGGATLKQTRVVDLASADRATTLPLAMGVDDGMLTAWILYDDGKFNTYKLSSGELVKSVAATDKKITALSNTRGEVAVGHDDGTVQVGRITQSVDYPPSEKIPAQHQKAKPGSVFVMGDAVVSVIAPGEFRALRTKCELGESMTIGSGAASPVKHVDYFFTDRLEAVTALREDGQLVYATITKRENMMTGAITTTLDNKTLELPARSGEAPLSLVMGLNAQMIYVIYGDGTAIRYNLTNPDKAFIGETVRLIDPKQNATISSVRMLLGNVTLIVADSQGGVAGWFPAPDAAEQRDELGLTKAHVLAPQASPVVAIGTSTRDRQFVTADATGNIVVRHMTSGTTQGSAQIKSSAPIKLVALSPKTDAVVTFDAARKLTVLSLDNPHPEGSFAQLFMPLHYEGYPKAGHVYQSSAGSDDAEPKLGLVPLIFGTIKATFYAMLFAVPVAIMAAIYSSEFMQPQVRAVVKPVIELMSSLPSVVLGFIGALIFAPFVENTVVAVLLSFLIVPLTMVIFGFLWQFVPPHVAVQVPAWIRFAMLFPLAGGALWACFLVGPIFENVLFYGDFQAWLGGRIGSPMPGWIVLLSPLLVLIVTLLFNQYLRPHVALYRPNASLPIWLVEIVRYALTLGIAIGVAYMIAVFMTKSGHDLRGSLVGGYVQRNSLIVGMLMGFAIIPIIFTVSEDALSSVPNTLRSAALGAGATPWQTAIRVVLPVATSGIFSACMIGFGRAAGETMIVLMASGRTPIMDVNIFNGLSALSANIATELSEAPVNSTHYRVLFVSALVLFVLTFIVNTTAEIIRLRFRKRAYQL
jgi:phosphate transport system permease protein